MSKTYIVFIICTVRTCDVFGPDPCISNGWKSTVSPALISKYTFWRLSYPVMPWKPLFTPPFWTQRNRHIRLYKTDIDRYEYRLQATLLLLAIPGIRAEGVCPGQCANPAERTDTRWLWSPFAWPSTWPLFGRPGETRSNVSPAKSRGQQKTTAIMKTC